MAPVGGLGGFRLLRARALAAATATVAVSAVVAAVTAPRSTVAVAMGAGPAPFPSRPSVSCVDGPRVRKEVGSLTPAEWATYQRAVTGLHARETSRDRSTLDWFEHFVEIHAAHAAYAHGGAHFLAWHRLFLLAYENALRTVEPSVTIPYWDWSMDAADPAMAPVWVTSQLGKSADGGRIGAGERAAGHNFNELFVDTDGPHYVTRGFDSNHRGSMDADFFADKRTVRALWRDRTMSFADFATTLEYVHGGPHVAVGGFSGGDMIMLNRAAGDVAFWSHHAYIDFICAAAALATVEAAVRPHFASSGPAGAARGPSSGDARAALAVLKKVMAAARAEAAAELAAAEAEAAEVISMADAEIHEVEEEEKAIAKAASEEGAVSRTAGWLAAAVRGASSVGSAGAVGAAAEAAKLAALEETRTEAEASRQAALAELQARKKEVKRYLRVTALAGFAAINGIDAARFTRGEAPLERAEDEAEAEERAIEGTAASTLTARHTLMGA
ncbi:hypothetical protein MMPV_001114 [Pyropia vietnamensis]